MIADKISDFTFNYDFSFAPEDSTDLEFSFRVSFQAINGNSQSLRVLSHGVKIWDGDDSLMNSENNRVPTKEQEIFTGESIDIDLEFYLKFPVGFVEFQFEVLSGQKTSSITSPKYMVKAAQKIQ